MKIGPRTNHYSGEYISYHDREINGTVYRFIRPPDGFWIEVLRWHEPSETTEGNWETRVHVFQQQEETAR